MRPLMIIFLTIIFSCKTSKNEQTPLQVDSELHDCQGLINFLKESWKKHKEGYFYFKNPPEDYNKIYYSKFMENCLRGKSKKDIKKIFGNSSADIRDRWYYYMSTECAKGNPPGNFDRKCLLLIIHFDSNDQVLGIPPITRYRPPIY